MHIIPVILVPSFIAKPGPTMKPLPGISTNFVAGVVEDAPRIYAAERLAAHVFAVEDPDFTFAVLVRVKTDLGGRAAFEAGERLWSSHEQGAGEHRQRHQRPCSNAKALWRFVKRSARRLCCRTPGAEARGSGKQWPLRACALAALDRADVGARLQALSGWPDPDSNRGHHDFQAAARTRTTGAVCRGLPELRGTRDAGGFLAIRGALGHRAGGGDPIASEAGEEAHRIGDGESVELRVEQIAVERDDRVGLCSAGERDEVVVVGVAHMTARVIGIWMVFASRSECCDIRRAALVTCSMRELRSR